MAPLLISLPQMVDMALTTPEPGCINLTVLHALLHILVRAGQFDGHRVEFCGDTAAYLEAVIAKIPVQSSVSIDEFRIVHGDAEQQPDKRLQVLATSIPAVVKTVLSVDAMHDGQAAETGATMPVGFSLRPMEIVSVGDLGALQSHVSSINDRLNAAQPSEFDNGDDEEADDLSMSDSLDQIQSEILERETNYTSDHSKGPHEDIASTIKSKNGNSFEQSPSQHFVPSPMVNPQLDGITDSFSQSEDIEFMLNDRLTADAEQLAPIASQTSGVQAKIDELTQKLMSACANTADLTKRLDDLLRHNVSREKVYEAELGQLTADFQAYARRLDNTEVTFTALIDHGVQFAEQTLHQQQELFLNTMIEVQQQLDAKVDRYSIPALKQWLIDQLAVFEESLDGFRRMYGMIPDAAGALMIHNVQCVSCQRPAMQRDREAPPAAPVTTLTSKRVDRAFECRPMPTVTVSRTPTAYELSQGTDGRMYRTDGRCDGGCGGRICCVDHGANCS